MQSNIWTLLTFLILPNGELDGNHLTYIFDNKNKCEKYLISQYESSIDSGKMVNIKYTSSNDLYLITIENNKT